MSRNYKADNYGHLYFLSFAVVSWVDVFTRREYKDIIVDNLNYCQHNKGMEVYAWCIMTNHVHLIVRAEEGKKLMDIIRDFKTFTSKGLIKAIDENPQESRKEWMLNVFKEAGLNNSNNTHYQFWQQDNHPIELYTNAVIEKKLDYLHQNPVVSRFVDEPEQYLYSSAIDYAGDKGLVKLTSLI